MKRIIGIFMMAIMSFAIIIIPSFSSFAASSDYSTSIDINITNNFKGTVENIGDSAFEFKLSAVDNAPMPADDRLFIDGSGESSFNSITYTQPGVFEYLVSPIQGKNENIEYDTTQYLVTVVVINIDGSPNNGLGAYVAAVQNVNTGLKTSEGLLYNSKGVSRTPSAEETPNRPNNDKPNTGDNNKIYSWLIIFIIAGVLLLITSLTKVKDDDVVIMSDNLMNDKQRNK